MGSTTRKSGKAPYVPLTTLEHVLAAQRGLNAARDRALILVSHYLGLRAKELAALKVEDVMAPNGSIREVVRLLGRMTKGEVYREVFLVHEATRAALTTYLTGRPHLSPAAPLFRSQRVGHFSANTMQRLLAICYRRANVKASSHSGRRSFATRLIEHGADIYSVKEMLGHASIATTQEYFATSPERLKRMARLLP